jgi:predicted O-linked N-acetylglucosamine transferase (SPINDLY family)
LAPSERAAAVAPDLEGLDAGRGQALDAVGRFAEAAAAYRRAARADPGSADLQFALGSALQSQGLHLEAIDAYEQALAVRPDHFAALNNLGNCQQRLGRIADAVSSYERALLLRPRSAGTLANLGTALQATTRIDEAVERLRTAVELEPAITAHAVNLGIALCRRRSYAEAADVLRGALEQEPTAADAAFNLGNAQSGLGLPRAAAYSYRRAVALRPHYVDALINLGNMQRELGEPEAAAAAYDAALALAPQSLVALNNLGCLLRSMGRLDEAEDALRQALRVDPGHAALHDNLGSVLKDVGELDAAIEHFRQSVALNPDSAATHSNLVYALNFQSPRAEPILAESLRWARRFAAQTAAAPRHTPEHSAERRLRVGYVSPDFREHCQSLFTIPVLSQHDHAAVEVYCYSSVQRPDERTRRIAALADTWREVRSLDDAALADLIRADRIDILVDLTMHMSRNRLATFARRPAPIQVTWLAYPGTTGLAAMDYRISDPRLDPTGYDAHYTERTIRLDSFWCYDPLTLSPPVNVLPALARGHITFGCLNNPCKLTPETLILWGGVLRALPDARLKLLAPTGRHRSRLSERLAAVGLALERVDFVPYRARAAYLSSYHDIDLGLDTLPYNGHTTSLDSLWMGVPTITRVGDTSVGRGGLSQLFHLGLTELAAATDSGFIDTAVALARDLPRLTELRAELRSRLTASALMDAPRFARQLESVYRSLWRGYRGADGA